MAGSGVSRAQENKRIRQEALREQLANKGLLQQAIENISKIQDLNNELESSDIHRLKTATELQLKLVNKYLPDVKAVEHTGDPDQPIEHSIGVRFVSGKD